MIEEMLSQVRHRAARRTEHFVLPMFVDTDHPEGPRPSRARARARPGPARPATDLQARSRAFD